MATTYASNEETRRSSGEAHPERLLASIPVEGCELLPGGARTAVLGGGAGPPIVLQADAGDLAAKCLRNLPPEAFLATPHLALGTTAAAEVAP